eukprot:CAMPEP_0184485846 /NCGR_PEP_ID=MMETSP0113_2-20130426/7436_1 /TAXON_ID=91329 /ORGANISM="Norrisiella sphaerica, Strain BC52" /LENGTH=383 /DNA_ID=CAMNT_0026867493 /DNA_START=838 /DNA_END=1989 /DNA_ORIENTATION=-
MVLAASAASSHGKSPIFPSYLSNYFNFAPPLELSRIFASRNTNGNTGLSLLLQTAASTAKPSISGTSSPAEYKTTQASMTQRKPYVDANASANAPPIRVISFDFTGTLAQVKGSTEDHYLMALKESIDNHPRLGDGIWKSLHIDNNVRPKILSSFGKAYKKQMKAIPNFGYGSMTSEQWWRDVIVDTLTESGIRSDLVNLVAPDVTKRLYTHFATEKAWQLYPEVIPLIRALNSSGIQLGVVSNFDARLKPILKSLGIADYFSFVLTSSEIGVEKPSALIFKEAMRRGGISSPEFMIHVGDTVKTDVLGPLDIGMPFVYVQRNAGGSDGSADSPQLSTVEELFADRDRGDLLVMRANTVGNLSAVTTFLEDGFHWQAENGSAN